MKSNTSLWLWFTEKPLTAKVKYNVYNFFGSIEDIYNASESDYRKVPYLKEAAVESLCDKNADNAALIKLYENNSVRLVSIDMDEYPEQLKNLPVPPLLLYCRGKFINLNERLCISVVGTRNMTEYGKTCAYNLSKELAQSGAIIVSGLADGIDACAHRGALDAGMPTVAIMGTGVNLIYPKKNASLAKEIIQTGMIISEYPLNTRPEKYHFPERNRIIAALSEGTLVVEAALMSGSLITAKLAYEQGKDVFAIPGNINSSHSKGTNYLIKDGAYCVTCAEDVLFPYKYKYVDFLVNGMNDRIEHNNIDENKIENISGQESIKNNEKNHISKSGSTEDVIYSCLKEEPISVDIIHEKTGISIAELNSHLLLMELSGKIKKCPGNSYKK